MILDLAAVGFGLLAWVGHAVVWTASLNFLYGQPIPKWFLKPYRLFVGLAIVAYPVVLWYADWNLGCAGWCYFAVCIFFGHSLLYITKQRNNRRPPACLLAEDTETVDYWKHLGPDAVGDGRWRWAVRLPYTDAFKVDYTYLTLAVPGLPAAWDGLTALVLSDLHFHGTPAKVFFDAVFNSIAAEPPPDLLLLAGDYLDSDRHHDWIVPLFSRLSATGGKFAILGNHDDHHDPERVRKELAEAGYVVLGNGWREVTVRGERAVICGHEGPWFRPGPDLTDAPEGLFRLLVSHSPDNVYWAAEHGFGLVVSGHVHGGQVRVPVVGSIFVPSVYGRRFDRGVFEVENTVLAVCQGLSGKEPLRVNCHAQVLRLTLRCRPASA